VAGEIGRVVHVEAVQGYDLTAAFGRLMATDPGHWVHRLPGGLAHNNLSHSISEITDLLPDDRPAVWATWFGDPARGGLSSELRAYLRGAEASASVLFTSAARPVQRLVRVYGTRRLLEVDFDGRVVRARAPVTAPGAFAKVAVPWREFIASGRAWARNAWRLLRGDLHYFAGMHELIRRFYRSVRDGTDPPVPERDIRRVTAVLDDIFVACRGPAVAPGRDREVVASRPGRPELTEARA
jgi:predicted dehydrogenase